MRPCQIFAENGNESLLYNRLFSLLGEDKASQVWLEYRSDQFRKRNPLPTGKEETDTNGEPTAEWVLGKMTIPVPKNQVVQADERSFDELKKKIAENPSTTYIIQASGNVRKLYDKIRSAALPNVRLEGSLRTLEMQLSELPSAAYPGFAPIHLDENVLLDQKRQLFLEKADGSFFTLQEQEELLSIATHVVYKQLVGTGATNLSSITEALVKLLSQMKTAAYDNIATGMKIRGMEDITPERAAYLSGLITDVFMQMDKVLGMLVERMEQRGLHIKNKELVGKEWHELLNEEMEEHPGKVLETQGRGLQDWSSVVFELDPATTASARIKMMLSVIPKSHYEGDKLVETRGIYGASVFEDFNKIFQEALGVLSKVTPDFDIYLAELGRHKDRPYLQQLAKILADPAKTPPHVRNEFVSVMNKHNESYRVVMWNKDRSGNLSSYQIEGNRGNMVQIVLGAWKEQQKSAPVILRAQDGTISLNKALLTSLKGRLEALAIKKPEEIKKLAPKLLEDLFAAHGIALPESAITYLIDKVELYTKGTDKEGDLKRQFSITKEGKPNGIFSALVIAEEAAGIGGIADGNPLYENQKTLSILARKVLPFLDGIYSISHQTIEGTKVWDYILHSSLTQQMRELTAPPSAPVLEPKLKGQMSFDYGTNGRPGLAATSTLQAIRMGERTATTRYEDDGHLDYWKGAKVGDIIQWTGADGSSVLVRVTKALTKLPETTDAETWSKKEGWSVAYFNQKVKPKLKKGAWQMEYEYVAPQAQPVNRLLEALNKNNFTKNNYLLQQWIKQPKLLEQFGVGVLEGMRESLDNTEGVTREDMSDREQLITALNLFANNGKSTASFISLTHADKSRSPVFFGVPRLDVFANGGAEVTTALLYAVKAEYQRVYTDPGVETSAQYEKGKKMFYFIPEMNFERMQDLVRENVLTEDEVRAIYDEQGNLTPWTKETYPQLKPVLLKVVNYAAKGVRERMEQRILSEGIISEENMFVDQKYLQFLLGKLGMRVQGRGEQKVYLQKVEGGGEVIVPADTARALIARAIARDYGLNAFVFNISVAQLFFGDPAEAFKGKGSQTLTDQIRSTMIEYEKRLAKDIAPRILPAWPAGATYRTLVLEDFVDRAAYIDNPAFQKIDATDAQEVITVEEHLDTLFYRGEISQEVHQEMTQIARENRGNYYEFTDPKHQGVMMRITKPVYTGRRDQNGGNMFHDYVKSAAMVLYPPAIRDTQWDALRNTMEWHDIRRAAFGSAYKVGAVKEPLKLFKPDGSFDLNVLHSDEAVNAAAQTLRRENLGIQQDRPWDEDKEKIKVVTQMDRLIVGGIADMSFTLNGTEKTGKQIRERKEEVVKKMVDLHTAELIEKLSEPGALYDWLIKQGMTNGVSANNLLQLSTRVNDEPVIPLAFNGAADKFQRMVLSAVKKAISFKVPGASFVQATGAGFQRMHKWEPGMENKGIVYVGNYAGEALKTAQLVNGTVRPAQVLVPFSYIQRFFPAAKLEDFIGEDGRVTGLPPEVLRMVLARIPNQGHNSMLPAEIVGFLPDHMGDTIIVPTAITKQMGSDFDVDKLYVYANRGGLQYSRRPVEDTLAIVRGELIAAGVSAEEIDAHLTATEEDRQAYEARFEDRDAIKEVLQAVMQEDSVDPELMIQTLEHFDLQETAQLEGINALRYRDLRKHHPKDFDMLALIKKALTRYNGSFAFNRAAKFLRQREDMFNERLKQLDRQRIFQPANNDEMGDLLQEYFDIHWSILTAPDVYPLMMSPLDKEDMKSEVTKTTYVNFFDPLYQLGSFLSQKDAKVLVGRGANALIGHTVMEPHDLKLGFKKSENGEVTEVETPIRVLDERTGAEHDLLMISGEGRAEYYSEEHAEGSDKWEKVVAQPRTKGENLSILLSEILDHAKHRTIDALNINSYTFGAYAAFLRLSAKGGYAVSHKYPSRLMQQDAIRQYAARMAKANDSFSGKFTSDARLAVIDAIEAEYKEQLKEMDPLDLEQAIQAVVFSPQKLQKLLSQPDRDQNWYISQIAALRLFMELDRAAKRIGEIQSYFNQLSAGPGDSVIEVVDKHHKVGNLANVEFKPEAGVLGATSIVTGETQAAYIEEATFRTVEALLGKELPIDAMVSVAESVELIAGREELTPKQQKELYNALIRHQLAVAGEGVLWANAGQERRRLMTGEASLAHRIIALKETLRNNALVRALQPQLSEQHVYGPHTVGFNQGFGIPDSELVKSWIDLLTSENEEEKAIGQDLVRYAVLSGAAFGRHIPTSFMQSSGMADKLRQMKENGYQLADPDTFVTQFVQHNPWYAERVKEDLSDLGYAYPYPPEVFVLPAPTETNYAGYQRFLRKDKDGNNTFARFVSMYSNGQWLVYQHDPTNVGRYIRIDTLGNRKLTEYSVSEFARSVFPINNALTPVDFGAASIFHSEPRHVLTPEQRLVVNSLLGDNRGIAVAALRQRMDPGENAWTEDMVRTFVGWAALQATTNDNKGADKYARPESLAIAELPWAEKWWDHYKGLTAQDIQNDLQFDWYQLATNVFEAPITMETVDDATARLGGFPRALAIGEEAVRQTLADQAANPAVPTYLRLMSEHLSKNPFIIHNLMPISLQVTEGYGKVGYAGEFNSISNFISLILNNNNRASAPETLVHEILHAVITNAQYAEIVTDKSQLDESVQHMLKNYVLPPGVTAQQLNDAWYELLVGLRKNKRLITAVQKLNTLFNAYKDGYQHFIDMVGADKLSYADKIHLEYAASNVWEFAVMVQSNKAVMEAANTITSPGKDGEPKTLFAQLAEFFSDFIKAVAEAIGIDVNKDSVLYESLKQVFIMHDELSRWNGQGFDPVKPPAQPKGGGMQFAPEQQKAIREIPLFAAGNKAQDPGTRKTLFDRTYVLSGPGGTGKTTVTKEVINALEKQGMSVAVFTTSHAARLVAQKALDGRQVFTIHSGLGVRLDVEETVKRQQDVFKRVEPGFTLPEAQAQMQSADVIIVDEASMLSTEFYEYINEDVRRNATIVLVGDYAQLPAVGDEEQDLFANQVRTNPNKTVLQTNFRSSIPDVLANIQAYRQWVDDIAAGKGTPMPTWEVHNTDNVKFLNKAPEFFQAYYDTFDSNSLANQVMIVYRNETRKRANQMIREHLFGKGVGADLVTGDHFMLGGESTLVQGEKANRFKGATGEDKVYNGERFIFQSKRTVKMDLKDLGIFGMEVDIWTVKHAETGLEIELKNAPAAKELIRKLKDRANATYDARSKSMKFTNDELIKMLRTDRLNYGQYKDLLDKLGAFEVKWEFAYAVTSHKSQGMEFNHVFVVEDDILNVGPTSSETKARSLYTAVSRTKQSTTIMTVKRVPQGASNFNQQAQMAAATFGQLAPTMTFQTEAQAQSAAQMITGKLNMAATTQVSGTTHLVHIRPATRAQMNGTPLEKAIALLQDRLNEMYGSLNDLKDKAKRAERMLKIQELQNQIDELKNQGDMRLVAGYGKRQLEWVKEVLQSPTNDANAIMTAYRLASMWSNILELLFTDKNGTSFIADPQIDEVYAEAGRLRAEMAAKLMPQFIIDNSVIPIGTKDFGDELQDEFAGTAQALALYRAKGKVAQELATTLTNAARMRDEEQTRLVTRIQEINNKYGPLLKDLIEVGKDSMGLIGPYTQKFYDWRREVNKRKQTALEAARSLNGNIPKANMRKAAWDAYRRELLKHATVVDVRALFSNVDGTALTTPEAQAERARLEAAFGKEQAASLIAQAERKLQKYMDLRDGLKSKLEAQVLSGQIDQATADKIMNGWMNHRSPFGFLENLLSGGKIRYNEGEHFTVIVPKADNKEFNNEKWARMQSNPQALEAFEAVNKILKELKRNLPLHVQWGMPPNFFPYVAKQFIQETLSIPEYIKTMPQQFVRDITGFESNTQEGIPIRFVDQMPGKDITEYSVDVPVVLEMFASMALHYKHFSRVKDYADMIYAKLAEVNRIRQEQGQTGLTNTLAAAQYNFDYLVYRNPKEREFKLGKIYSANPLLHMRISKKVEELMAKKYDVEQAYAKGDISDTEYIDQLKEIDDELQKYDGMTMYGSRIGDKLISIAQLKALSYNPFSAVANLAFGMLTAATYANGREDYTLKNLFTAMKLMNGSVGKFFSFGGIVTGEVEKVFNIIERSGVMGDVVDSHYGKTRLKTGRKKWWEVIGPYNMMRGSDYYMKAVVTLAMMIHKKVTVNGKEISLFEAFDKDGYWDAQKYGAAPEWYSENVEEQTAWNEFVGKVARVNTIIMGNQDRNSPKLFNKKILGRLIGQFRLSWLPEGFATRFEDERFDPYLKREIKGRYRTYADLGLGGSLLTLGRQLASVVTKQDPFAGTRVRKGEEMVPMSDADKTNMRRNFAGVAFTLGLFGAIVLLKAAISGAEDDEEDKTALQIMLNMIIRQKQDMMLYASPSVFDTVTRNLIPATDVINDYMKLVAATGKFMFNEDYEFEQWILKVTKAGLPIPQATLVNKIKFMSERDIDDVLK